MQAKACSSASIARLKNLNRRTVDVLASRLYFYYSLSYELTGDLSEIRGCVLYWFSILVCQCLKRWQFQPVYLWMGWFRSNHKIKLHCYLISRHLFAVTFLLCIGLLLCVMMSWGRSVFFILMLLVAVE